MVSRTCLIFLLVATLFGGSGCKGKPYSSLPADTGPIALAELPEKLSAFHLFLGNMADQAPAAGVLHYDLNSPLFSDYTTKYRFIKLPAGTSMKYVSNDDAIEFPTGTIIAKTFAYLKDQRDPIKGQRLLETRILRKGETAWEGVSYAWNDAQTEATLKLTGTVTPSKWIHTDGTEKSNAYIVPNANQCKSCHGNNNNPIGPRPRNLDRDFIQNSGPKNQLERWAAQGTLQNLPEHQQLKALPVWNNPATGSLDQRARAWLDINCAHCHQPSGGARQSGLDLRYTQTDPAQHGIMKMPIAAGRGSGGRLYDIVPGKPEGSVLVFRLESTEPGIMMPELPRRMVDVEGVKLIKEWIDSMKKRE
ncbi:MAG TPA: SO2930 family diheme c-type cytochrome [Gemmatales bacterium]|nr:SO2930 family diheme c-type cytochrome [Gemmatales bacterium]